MEATGIYHLTLLSYLLEQELNVSVVTIKPTVREKEKLTYQISTIKTDIKSIVNQVFP